jgi:hypothetical protein
MLYDIRPALRAYLLADSTIAAMVGTRIHPTVLPQGATATTPAIVYNVVSEVTDHVTTGASGLVMVRLQLDAYAPKADDADALARAVKERIDGKAGIWTYGNGSPPDGVKVQGVFSETARTGYEADAEMFRVGRDFLIHFDER